MKSSAKNSATIVAKASRRRRLIGGSLVALALVVTAACGGSQISPKKALEANQRILGTTGSGTGTGTGDPGTGTGDPGTIPGTDPGANPTTGPGANPTSGPGANPTGGPGPSLGGIKVGSCTGFKNRKGITDKVITLGNSSDISGPVPGLFTGAQQATKAYVAYFNANSNICGRKLQLLTYDSRTDAGADQQGYQKICENAFAALGSMSAFDSGGAATAEKCGLPDIRTATVTLARNECSTCFATQPTGKGEYSNGVYDFWIKRDRPSTQKAAFLYLNAGAAAENARTQIAVGTKRGMKWIYTSGIDVAEFNYGPYVQQIKSKGVQFVQFIGAYQQSVRLAQALQSANYKPKIRFYDPSVYDQGFLKQGGSAVEGTYLFTNFSFLDENNPEINLYKQWLQQVAPGAQPTFFGLYAWTASKLFVEKALALGGKLTPQSLVAAMKTVHAYTGGGAHGPMDVGGKHAPSCVRFAVVKGGKFVPFGGTKYLCNGYTRA